MPSTDIFKYQLSTIADTSDWFVSLKDALNGLSAADAVKTTEGNHSIWELVYHIWFWNDRWLRRLRNEKLEPMAGDNETTFEAQNTGEEQWNALQNKLHNVLASMKQEAENITEAKWMQNASKENPMPWYKAYSNLVTHTVYHIGQIVTLRKTLGVWSPDQGVK